MTLRSVISHNIEGRLFEWGMAFAMLCLALEIFLWPLTLGASAFRYLALVVNTENVGLLFFCVAIARGAALIVNGRSDVYGPRVRAVAAMLGAVIWAQMLVALFVFFAATNNPPSPGIPIYFVLTACELISCYRAATDVRNRRL
jgi:hypothetical protein